MPAASRICSPMNAVYFSSDTSLYICGVQMINSLYWGAGLLILLFPLVSASQYF